MTTKVNKSNASWFLIIPKNVTIAVGCVTPHFTTKVTMLRITSKGLILGYNASASSNHLFIGPLPTFPENFMQIRSEVFAQSW